MELEPTPQLRRLMPYPLGHGGDIGAIAVHVILTRTRSLLGGRLNILVWESIFTGEKLFSSLARWSRGMILA
jgi:hypothetical protein